jgi:Tfp pilus assembly protein PilX
MRRHDSSRGSALLTAVITVLIITVIGMAMIKMTYRGVASSAAGAHEQALVACAEAAKVQLSSRLHALGFNPTTVQALSVNLAGSRTVAMGAHYDTPRNSTGSPAVVIEQVSMLPPTAAGAATANNTPEISNRLSAFAGGGGQQPFKVIALCKDGFDGASRELEIEFGIVFGM